MTETETKPRDYRDTVFLPQTDFAMKAGLPEQEPKWITRWAGQYAKLRADRAGAESFVLHDGPPYANGDIHIGHALNKILKDFVVRANLLMGKNVSYIPGWDCHGLPIEWKVEEKFRAEGRQKGEIDKAEFRTACRAYAAGWLDTQRAQFQRLGLLGDFENRYATMDFASEAKIVAEFHKFVQSGLVYRALKPVMWSPVEQTALAEAEVEYQDKTSTAVWVKFPVSVDVVGDAAGLDTNNPINLKGASVVIWTTTPWTLPGNRAISYGPNVMYDLIEVTEAPEGNWAKPGDKFVVANQLIEAFRQAAKITNGKLLGSVNPEGLICSHPLEPLAPDSDLTKGYGFGVPLIPGDHVTDDAGTGFVHTAPGHGVEDYEAWLKAGKSRADIPETVGSDGAYLPHVPLFAGLKVIETEGKDLGKDGPANKAVIDKLVEVGALLARAPYKHSYPHSWRSRAPVIFRATPQWFIGMDIAAEGGTLREKALAAIAETEWHPAQAQNRIRSMVENRPDWLVSRQRAWGTPLAIFASKKDGKPLADLAVLKRIQEAISARGADAWFTTPAADLLGPGHNPADFDKIDDILDVWFDSGCTHAFTFDAPDSAYPVADLYLEGSDQHRGWFQSSLLESCGTRGTAPYKAVLTHGFVLDEQGRKMSKSLGNVVDPLKIADQSGAEILRLWVAMSDYGDDLRCGPEILKGATDAYRKLRNTLRYLLGALHGYSPAEATDYTDMPSLEQYILHRVAEVDRLVRQGYAAYDFRAVFDAVFTFATNDLSAFYFDIRKDSLYCDPPSSITRKSCRTVMAELHTRLCQWLSPLLAFTTEEAWAQRYPNGVSVHETPLPPIEVEKSTDHESHAIWHFVKRVRRVVTGAIELKRAEKQIGSSLEADVTIYFERPVFDESGNITEDLPSTERQILWSSDLDIAEICITSAARIVEALAPENAFRLQDEPNVAVVVHKAQGHKCVRSWKILPEDQMIKDTDGQWMTKRDHAAVQEWEKMRGV